MPNFPTTFPPVLVNGRYRGHQITGVQRYAHEIVQRLGERVRVLEPAQGLRGAKGHAWEQSSLALAARQQLLWNPCGNGPLIHDLQITTFHDLFPIDYPEWYDSTYSAWYKFSMMRLARNAKHLIAVSEYTKARLLALTGRRSEEITVIPNGCSMQGRATEHQIHLAKTNFGLQGRRYVLSLSSREKRKNLPMILRAWSMIYNQLPEDTWLVLAGAPPDARVYGEQSVETSLPRVLFTGYVPEEHLCGLYSGASVFLYPSLAEGFGLPLVEAMGCGVRCITSSTTSMPEVGGDVVDYVNPHRPEDLAVRLLQRLRLPDDGPFLPAMKRAAQFNWQSAADRVIEVFQGVQERSRQGSIDAVSTRVAGRRSTQLLPLGGRALAPSPAPLRVALVHDWLTGMRGGEKVLEHLCQRFPAAPLYTLLHLKGTVDGSILQRPIHTSLLQWMPRVATRYRNYLPLFPAFAEMNKAHHADLVISSSHCMAKGMVRRSGPSPYHICYIHTPMRYAWDRFDDYFGPAKVGSMKSNYLFRPVINLLRRYDRRTASRVDVFVANSRYVAERVRHVYGRPAQVLAPPVDTERFSNTARTPQDWYLVVSALVPYKKVDHAIRACAELKVPLKVVGHGPDRESLERLAHKLHADVHFVGPVSDEQLGDYYGNAKALLFPGIEDFGIVPVEALASGCPVVALAQGGVLDSLSEAVSQLYSDDSPAGLAQGIRALEERLEELTPERLRAHARQFSTTRFMEGFERIITRTLPHISLTPSPSIHEATLLVPPKQTVSL
jgi:glycosyltransferase involved in cell wall biosynthesis